MHIAFQEWVQGRQVQSLGTNAGSEKLPFQSWRNFKEAFAPELIARAVSESNREVQCCIDPFGGSGTTALACQFLGVKPTTIEVNPYLADLIEAKLATYDISELSRDFSDILRSARANNGRFTFAHLPRTFVYPGVKDRWIYPLQVATRIESFRLAIRSLTNEKHRRFFYALLGGIVVEVSNVYVNGKGRRYRQNWQNKEKTVRDVDELFCSRVQIALCELVRYASKPEPRYTVLRGDARKVMRSSSRSDLAIFSPPYPNSFDYTDIYNVELWMLGYLGSPTDNQRLRKSTLSSHVSILRDFSPRPKGSKTLNIVSSDLHKLGPSLWNKNIPNMVDAYFSDMAQILRSLKYNLRKRGEIWMVVGDSRYAGIHVPVAKILVELSRELGLGVLGSESFRSMRSSAQQGGQYKLDETLVVLRKEN